MNSNKFNFLDPRSEFYLSILNDNRQRLVAEEPNGEVLKSVNNSFNGNVAAFCSGSSKQNVLWTLYQNIRRKVKASDTLQKIRDAFRHHLKISRQNHQDKFRTELGNQFLARNPQQFGEEATPSEDSGCSIDRAVALLDEVRKEMLEVAEEVTNQCIMEQDSSPGCCACIMCGESFPPERKKEFICGSCVLRYFSDLV